MVALARGKEGLNRERPRCGRTATIVPLFTAAYGRRDRLGGGYFFNPLSEAHERLGRRCALFCIDTGFIWMHMFAFVFFLVYIDFVC